MNPREMNPGRCIGTAGAAATVALLGALGAHAADAPPGATVTYGAGDPGAVTCALLLRMHERAPEGTRQQFFTYLQGYVAGLRALGGDFAEPDPAERERHVTALLDHCRAHPGATVRSALGQLWPVPGPVAPAAG